jgi:hypothetical protein
MEAVKIVRSFLPWKAKMLYVYVANVSLARTSWLREKEEHSVEAWR